MSFPPARVQRFALPITPLRAQRKTPGYVLSTCEISQREIKPVETRKRFEPCLGVADIARRGR
ncbi:hypothetical protein BDZ89DRAFT_1065194 [Hymenopellis radicata]|nr:hypothetical protein BDZ89DRAFT_1065194 [Hymenopellis radicata]